MNVATGANAGEGVIRGTFNPAPQGTPIQGNFKPQINTGATTGVSNLKGLWSK